MDEQTFTTCPHCGAEVDPDDPNTVYGVEQATYVAMGPTHHVADRFAGYFHEGCSPEAVGYARRERPGYRLSP